MNGEGSGPDFARPCADFPAAETLLPPGNGAPQAATFEDWFRDSEVATVKTGRHRTVYRIDRADGQFYLKLNRHVGWRARLLALVRPSKSERERSLAECVRGLGIPTVEPVAVGTVGNGTFREGSYLVSRAITESVPLDEFLQGGFLELDASQQSRLRQELARLVGTMTARLHTARLLHDDFHPGNFLLQEDAEGGIRLSLIDLADMQRHRSRLSTRQILGNLSQLDISLHWALSKTDRLRFFRAYWHALRDAASNDSPRNIAEFARNQANDEPARRPIRESFFEQEWKAVLRAVDLHRRRAMRLAAPRFDRKWIRGNRRLLIADAGEIRCRGLAGLGREQLESLRDEFTKSLREAPGLEAFASEWPKRLSLTCEKHELTATSVFLPGEPISRLPYWLQSLSGLCRGAAFNRVTPARRAWEIGHACLRRGIPTPLPLAFVESGSGSGNGWLYMADVSADALPLSEFLKQPAAGMSPQARSVCLARLSEQFGTRLAEFHAWGFDYEEFSSEMLLIGTIECRPRLWFTGMQHVKAFRRMTHRLRTKALARMYATLKGTEATPSRSNCLRFLRCYLRASPRGPWKDAWRRISRCLEVGLSR